METRFTDNLSELSYVLSGKRAFFYRYCDTGFKNKWTGLWAMPYKYLEYFALKVNGEWLSPSTIKSFSSYEERTEHVVHEFKLKELDAKEFWFVPEDYKAAICRIVLKNPMSEEKGAVVELESAVNIREREENWHDTTYAKSVFNGKVVVKSDRGCLVFGSNPNGSIVFNEQYKDHCPSGEMQRCFIPGIYRITVSIPANSKEEIVFIFACGENEVEALFNFENVNNSFLNLSGEERGVRSPIERVRSSISSGSKSGTKPKFEPKPELDFESGLDSLDKLFRLNVIALEKLAFDSKFGLGYFAGFPWFTQFWGRDLGWMIPAIVDYGNFENAKETLRTLAKFQSRDGAIPNTVYMDAQIDYNSIDATPLWIIALDHYIMNSGDKEFLEEIKDNLHKSLNWCRSRDVDKDGFVEHGTGGKFNNDTWMDTLDRGVKAVEVQAFWIESLKSASNLYKIMGDETLSNNLKKEAMELKNKFELAFWNSKENFYCDRITTNGKDTRKTINAVFPLLFNISRYPKKVLKKFEDEEFFSPFGVRTISKYESIFNPNGYHTGAIWGFTTLALACAEFLNNRTKKGLEILEMISGKMFENCVGAIGEVWNSETNELIGCCMQGWSSALAIRCVDEYFLGLKVNAFENSIIVSPSLPEDMHVKRRKRIGDDFIDLDIERNGNNIRVGYASSKKKTYKIIVAPKQ